MNESDFIGDGIDLEHTEANVERIKQTPLNELGEGGPAIVFDVPNDLDYDGMEIPAVLWNGVEIILWYIPDDWDAEYFALPAEGRDGTITVTGYGPGIMEANAVFETYPDAPHAEFLRPIYQWLLDEGVEFEDYDE